MRRWYKVTASQEPTFEISKLLAAEGGISFIRLPKQA
jgi:hypothetical protein